jgi:carboxymethylenebutenolidase
MIVIDTEHVDLDTPTGPMRTHIVRPAAPGRYPGIVLYSEIFQVTGPIHRTAVLLAGHGYVVAIPEIYHEYEPAGTVLKYDQEGSDRGNVLKTTKPVQAYDDDARAVLSAPGLASGLHRQAGRDGHLHRRPPGLSRRHEPRSAGRGLLLCDRHP